MDRSFKNRRDEGYLGGSAIKHPTPDFHSGQDLRVIRWSPTQGSSLSTVCLSLSDPAFPALPPACALSYKINKVFKNKRRDETLNKSVN